MSSYDIVIVKGIIQSARRLYPFPTCFSIYFIVPINKMSELNYFTFNISNCYLNVHTFVHQCLNLNSVMLEKERSKCNLCVPYEKFN